MKNSENASASYFGHVQNGVVILDSNVALSDGQAVRIEPLPENAPQMLEQADRVRRLQQLFSEWTEEDGKLSDEDADRLHLLLSKSRGLGFRSPMLD